jgi:hypothetical protein
VLFCYKNIIIVTITYDTNDCIDGIMRFCWDKSSGNTIDTAGRKIKSLIVAWHGQCRKYRERGISYALPEGALTFQRRSHGSD